jgi:phosphatidylserine decarboxylase
MKTPEFPIAREGIPFILFCGFAALVFSLLQYAPIALLALAATGFVTWFFRDPSRIRPEDANAVVCPADGKVIIIEEIFDDRFLQHQVVKISVFMNVFNVHVNRIPFPGTVKRVFLQPGRFYSADKDKAALHNEYCAVTVATPSGKMYAVVQVAGLIARRIICWAEPGDRVAAGQRYGLIRFGSRVDIYLPPDTPVEVQLGEKVRAGETILARIEP